MCAQQVEATVRTVEADEDGIIAHIAMRAVSFNILHCVHSSHSLVFKVRLLCVMRVACVYAICRFLQAEHISMHNFFEKLSMHCHKNLL